MIYSPLMMALKITNDEGVIRELLEGGADVNKVDYFGKTPLLMFLHRKDCSVGIVEVLLDFKADVNRMDLFDETPLAAAIRQAKDDAVIRVLVERGANVNVNFKNTPLLMLLLWHRINCPVDIIKLFLSEGASINCVDKDGNSPLVTALKKQGDKRVIQALLENGANVNMVDKFGETPLSLYLNSYYVDNCSINIVKLLLHYEANVNSRNSSGNSPLITALINKRGETIIRMLLEGGAGVDACDGSRKSPLCIAFRHSSNDIVKLLLDAGSSPNACKYHRSALHCATDFSCSGLREDILKLLLETNLDVDSVDYRGQSVLCYALQKGAKAHDIQLLLDAGASLNTCTQHSSPLTCATDGYVGSPLRKGVVQLLLDNGASVGDDGLRVLSGALARCRYETGAIQLLLDLPGMDAYVVEKECDKSLLHLAVQNGTCRLDAVKLLVNRKAQVHKTNQMRETPLHSAVRNKTCDPSIIKFLLQNGSPVNAKDKYDETPLKLAVKMHQPSNILKDLLIAGAHIGKTKFCYETFLSNYGYELLEFLARQWEAWDSCRHPETINNYKMLMKFFLLQNPKCDVENYLKCNPVTACMCVDKLTTFLRRCLSELRIMDSLQVGHGHTFRMFVSRECLSVDKMYDLDRILICLINYMFPVFFDVISARIGRSIMEAEVKKLHVYYTRKSHLNLHFSERIHLNSDIVYEISKYLPDDDLLKFILAFYKPINQNDSAEASKDHTLLGKRNSESTSTSRKWPKMYR